MIFARAQTELDQSARVGHSLALPTLVCLVTTHGLLTRLVPRSCGFSSQIVLADQGFLDRLGSF